YSTAVLKIFRFRLTTLGAAGLPSSRTASRSSTDRSTSGLLSADTGRVWLSTQRSAARTSAGRFGSSRRTVLNAHRHSADRISLPSGWPGPLGTVGGGTAVSASAWVGRGVAAPRGHFISTNAHANSYHDISNVARRIEIGQPDSTSNASPFRCAVTSSERKLS